MPFRGMTFGVAAFAVLAATSVVGATPMTDFRGHTAASITAAAAASNPLDPLTADEIRRTFTTIDKRSTSRPGRCSRW